MANRKFETVQALERQLKIIAGSFRPNGTNAVDNTLNTGHGFSVTHDGTGLFTITLEDKYMSLIAGHVTLQCATAGVASIVRISASDVASAKTISLTSHAMDGTTENDIASDTNNRVHFTLFLKNSSVF